MKDLKLRPGKPGDVGSNPTTLTTKTVLLWETLVKYVNAEVAQLVETHHT